MKSTKEMIADMIYNGVWECDVQMPHEACEIIAEKICNFVKSEVEDALDK